MLKKIKEYFAKSSYTTVKKYVEGDCEVQFKESEAGEFRIDVTRMDLNERIEIAVKNNAIEHVIYDSARGITSRVRIPVSVYEHLLQEPTKTSNL